MKRDDLLWLAGFLEGEGTFINSMSGNRGTTQRLIVNVFSTDRDVVERVARLLHVNVNGPHKRTSPHNGKPAQDQYCARLERRADVVALITQLQPLMGMRRQAKIQEMLDASAKYPIRPRGRPRSA